MALTRLRRWGKLLFHAAAHPVSGDSSVVDFLDEIQGVGIWELDLQNNIVRLSSQMLRLHEISDLDEAVALPELLACIHPDDLPRVLDAMARAEEGAPQSTEYRVPLRDGTTRFVLNLPTEMSETQGGHRIRGIAIDVTEHHDREAGRDDALAQGQSAAVELRAIDEQKDLFLRAVSHDLRTPLTVMHSFASILVTQDDRLDSATRRDYAGRIERGALRLERQLNDLLDLDRLSRGVLEPRRQWTDMRRLAADVVEALDLAERVTVQGDAVRAFVDLGQVERIVENLVANACRHTPPGSRVEVRSELVDDGLLISVEDDGPGIPSDQREKVFEVFHKLNPLSSGTGVGLPLVQRFAEIHGGRVWIEDSPRGGATFRVFLPSASDVPDTPD